MYGEVSHGDNNIIKLILSSNFKFEPRFEGDKLISFDIVRNYVIEENK